MTTTRTAPALWYLAPGTAEIRDVDVPDPGPGEVLVRTAVSALSRGTERLVFNGRVPRSEWRRMRAPLQEGDFPFPVKYGYAAVGTVEAGPDALLGRTVFCLHPHQGAFVAPASMAIPVPDDVPPARAALAANMETALNGLWDAGAGPADRIAVVGGGVLGLLLASVAARLPGAEVHLVDVEEARAPLARALGARFAGPDDAEGPFDVVFHTSATAAGLATAIGLAGFEARVVEMSWYGEGTVAVPLGGTFHAQRLTLVSSQVGAVSAGRRARRTHGERLAAALSLLREPALDRLLEPAIPLHRLPDALPTVLGADVGGPLCQIVDHG